LDWKLGEKNLSWKLTLKFSLSKSWSHIFGKISEKVISKKIPQRSGKMQTTNDWRKVEDCRGHLREGKPDPLVGKSLLLGLWAGHHCVSVIIPHYVSRLFLKVIVFFVIWFPAESNTQHFTNWITAISVCSSLSCWGQKCMKDNTAP
jgi:hypothetical protein